MNGRYELIRLCFSVFIAAAAIVIITITFGLCWHDKIMVENGYEQVTASGHDGFLWQKTKEAQNE